MHYSVCAAPGGTLPAWIQRLATRRTIPDNVTGLIVEAVRRRAAEDDAGG